MCCKILKPEHYVLVCCKQWKKRPLRESLSQECMIDFNPHDQTTINYLKHYRLYDLARPERHFINRTEMLTKMISKGFGYGVLTTEFIDSYLPAHQLWTLNQSKTHENLLALAWFERPQPPAYFSGFIEKIN